MIIAPAVREGISCRNLLDLLRPHAQFAQGIVMTMLPRGGLQIAQPLNFTESILKAYTGGLHAEDVLSWRAILKVAPVRLSDIQPALGSANGYLNQVLTPLGIQYALALPLAGPILEGYPGAVHLLRTEHQGDFTDEEVASLMQAVHAFDTDIASSRPDSSCDKDSKAQKVGPPIRVAILDSHLNALTPGGTWAGVDENLRHQMVEQARLEFSAINGHDVALNRFNLPDSHGDQWVFNRVVYKRYPALGEGPFTFFCLQPACGDWNTVRPVDLQADPELSRLMPSLKFMHQEYVRGPSLTEISQQVKLSPFHFHRRFTELLGMTPKQYMLGCQIHRAKSGLLGGEKELADIAKECGFAHQSHFTSRFKQATGLTPTRWRRMAVRRRSAVPANN